MIRVLCVDDHPALRAGLLTVIRREPGLVARPAVGSAREAIEAVEQGVDIVLVDYRLPDLDGLRLCVQLKDRQKAPRVLIYSAHAHDGLALPARLAGADGLIDKAASADVLLDAIRTVARGGTVFPDSVRELASASADRLDPEDLPILGMIADGASRSEVAAVMRTDPAALARRIDRMIAALKADIAMV